MKSSQSSLSPLLETLPPPTERLCPCEEASPRNTGPLRPARSWRREIAVLLLLTFGALLVHGYHPYAEDAEIYVPGIVHVLHPSDFPEGRQFFEAQAKLTLFTSLVVWSVRLTRLPLDGVLFLWQLASIFLLLYACWRIACKCFPDPCGRWGAVAMVAALLTLPVAGTSLYILDQYFNPRSLSIFAVLFAIDAILEKKYLRAGLWFAFTALVHPLMAVFGISYLALLYFRRRVTPAWAFFGAALFFPELPFHKPSAAYLAVLAKRPGLFLLKWQWYEWLGALAPLVLLYWFSRIARRRRRAVFEQLASSMALFGLIYFVGAVASGIPRSLITLIRFQPMRSLLLVYLFLLLFAGGLLGEFVLRRKPVRWALLFVPICAGMFFAQLQLFPASRHIEWPGATPENRWEQAFLWVRGHTPTGAVFALDPKYMAIPGEDNQGFHALAERSSLATLGKSVSVAGLFPGLPLATECLTQVRARKGWRDFTPADYERLKRTYGVTWVVVRRVADGPGLTCPYQNSAVAVCKIN
jgi:hypothetical protein